MNETSAHRSNLKWTEPTGKIFTLGWKQNAQRKLHSDSEPLEGCRPLRIPLFDQVPPRNPEISDRCRTIRFFILQQPKRVILIRHGALRIVYEVNRYPPIPATLSSSRHSVRSELRILGSRQPPEVRYGLQI